MKYIFSFLESTTTASAVKTSTTTTVVNNTNKVGTSTETLLINTKGTAVFETRGSTSDEATHTSSSTLQKTTTQASNSPISNDNQSKTVARTANSGSTPPFISDTQTFGTRTNDTTVTDAITDEDTVTAVETNKLTSLSSNTVTTTKNVGTTADTPLTNKERTFTVSKINKSSSDETTHTATANLLETAADQFSVSQITNNKSTETTETMARPETPTKTSTSISDTQAIGFTTDDTTATETKTSETTVTDAKSIELTYSSNIVGPTNTTIGTTAEKRLIDTDGTTTVPETHGSPSDNTAQTSATLLMETTADQALSSQITYDEPREISNIITNSTTPTKTQATISESQTIDFTTDDSNLTDAIPHEDAVTAAETIKSTSISNTVVTTTNTVDTSVTKPLNNTKGTTVFETHGSKSDETTRTSTSTLIKTTAQQTSNSPPTYTKLGVTTETMVGSKAQTKTPAFISNTKTIGSRKVDTTISEVSVTAAKTIKHFSITNTIGTTEETPLINTEGMTTVSETRDPGSDAITHTAVTTLLETTTEQALVSPTTNNKPMEMTDTTASTAMPTKTISETQGPTFDKSTHTAAITLQKNTQASNAPITNENQTKTITSTANPGSIPPFISDTQTIGTRTNDTTVTDAITDENTVTTAKLMPIIIGTSTKTIGTTAENQFINTNNTSIVSQNHGRPTDETTHTAATNLLETTTDQSSVSSFTNYKRTKTTNPIARPDTLINTSAFISNTQMIGFTTDDNTATATTISEATDTDAYAIQRTSMFNTAGITTKTVGSIPDKHLTNTEGAATIFETNEPTSDETTYTAAKSLVTITVDRASDSPNPNENPMETTETIGSSTTQTKTSKSMYDTQTNDFKTDDTMMTNTSISDAPDTNANTIHLTSMSNTTMTNGTTTDKHLISTKDTNTVFETYEPKSDETFFTAATTLVTITADQSSVPPIANDKPTKTTETIASSETPTQTSQSIYDTQTIGFTTDDNTVTDTTTSEATVTAAKTIEATLISNTAGITTRTIGTITDKHLTNTEGTTTVSETRGLTSDETTYTAPTTLLQTTAAPASVTSIVNDKMTEKMKTIANSETPTKTSTSISDTQTIGFTTDDITMTNTTTIEATDTAAKNIQLTSMSSSVGITTKLVGNIPDKHLTNTEGTTTVSQPQEPPSDKTTHTAATTLLKTTADQTADPSITNDKPTETTYSIDYSQTPTKTSTSIFDSQTIGITTVDTMITDKTIIEATDTGSNIIQLTSMYNTADITSSIIGTTTDQHLTNTEGTTIVSETHEPPSDETTHTAATILLETSAGQSSVTPITNYKPTETMEATVSYETPIIRFTSMFDTQTIGFTTDDNTVTDTTTSEATVTAAKTIEATLISNTAGITTRTIGTITDKHLTNTEGTTTVSETRGLTSDETTYTAPTTLLQTTADPASVTSIVNDKMTEKMKTIANSETPAKTSTSISDTQSIGFTTDDITITNTTTIEATDTAAKNIQLTSMSNTVGITTKRVGNIPDKHLTNTEGTTTVFQSHGPTSDETTHTAATTLIKTNANQSADPSITNDKQTETTDSINRSETPTKKSTPISNTQTVGFITDDPTMTDTASEATVTAAKTNELTSISNTASITTRTIGATTDKHLTSTKGTAIVSETYKPTSDETTYTAATTLLKTTADSALVTSITNDKLTETTDSIDRSETSTKKSTPISDFQTIVFTTDDPTMSDKTSEATVTAAKTIELTSISNTAGITTRTIGATTDKHLTSTKGTTIVSETYKPTSDETTYTAATTLLKTTADSALITSITNDKLTETTDPIDRSETPTKKSTPISNTQTIGFTTDDPTMTDTASEATVTAAKTNELTSISNTAIITTRTIGATTDKHLTSTKGTAIVSETYKPTSDETTYTAATTLLKTTADSALVTSITNDKLTETIDSIETSTKKSTPISDIQTIVFTTDDPTMSDTTSEATVTAAKTIELTSMSYTVDITTNTVDTTEGESLINTEGTTFVVETHELKSEKTSFTTETSFVDTTVDHAADSLIMNNKLTSTSASSVELSYRTTNKNIDKSADISSTNTEGTTIFSETHEPPFDKTANTSLTTLVETTAGQALVSPITINKQMETTDTKASAATPTKTLASISETNGFTTDYTTVTDATINEATVISAKKLTSVYNTPGTTTNNIDDKTVNIQLTNNEGTTVSKTHRATADESTHKATTTLLETTAVQTSNAPFNHDKPTELTDTVAGSETLMITSASISDFHTIGTRTYDTTVTKQPTDEVPFTASENIKLTSTSAHIGTIINTVGTTAENSLTSTEGTTTIYETHGPTIDKTTITAAYQPSIIPITDNGQTETTDTIDSSATPSKTTASISETQTVGLTTDDATVTDATTSEATITVAKTIELTSKLNYTSTST
ncbi:mucin-3A-like [Mytilus trossulus]|uniref:mucin-3A-like n=1 Tax=Mytilus trossulus TaxID=6551 RepID=UPI003003EC4B